MAEQKTVAAAPAIPPGGLLAHVRAHRTELLAVAERYGATNLRLFGSTVRGEERPDSDVDMLADLPETLGLLDIARLELAMEDVLGRTVDVVEPDCLNRYIKRQIFAEALPL